MDQLTLGGRVDLAAQVSGTFDDLSVDGNLQVRRGSLRGKSDKWQVGPMNLALPFRVHLPAATREGISASIPAGALAIESLRFGTESIPELRTPVSLWNNTLKFDQPIRVPIYGGTIEIRTLAWADLIGDPQAFSLAIEAKDVQLQRLTESLGWYRFGGILSGSIPNGRGSAGNVLRREGQIEIGVFGGHVQVSKTEIENPFSSLPAIKLDARFQEIHLEQASENLCLRTHLRHFRGHHQRSHHRRRATFPNASRCPYHRDAVRQQSMDQRRSLEQNHGIKLRRGWKLGVWGNRRFF